MRKILFNIVALVLVAGGLTSCFDEPETQTTLDEQWIEIEEATFASTGGLKSGTYVFSGSEVITDSVQINLAGPPQDEAIRVDYSILTDFATEHDLMFRILNGVEVVRSGPAVTDSLIGTVFIPAEANFTYITYEVFGENMEAGDVMSFSITLNAVEGADAQINPNFDDVEVRFGIVCPVTHSAIGGTYQVLKQNDQEISIDDFFGGGPVQSYEMELLLVEDSDERLVYDAPNFFQYTTSATQPPAPLVPGVQFIFNKANGTVEIPFVDGAWNGFGLEHEAPPTGITNTCPGAVEFTLTVANSSNLNSLGDAVFRFVRINE